MNLRWIVIFLIGVGVSAGTSTAWLLGGQTYPVGPLTLHARWAPSLRGVTELRFPPLGTASAATHRGPTRLIVTLEAIDLDALGALLAAGADDGARALRQAATEAQRVARRVAARWIALALAGGAVGGLAARSAFRGQALGSWRRAAAFSGLAGAAALTVAATLAWATYEPRAFRTPTYRGALESAPWVIDAVQEAVGQVEEVEARLRALVANLYQMYQRLEELPRPMGLDEADLTILHVSDFHNHPAAIDIAREFAELFAVDFVVTTGDLTDFGTRLEAGLLQGLREFPVPHFVVTGNHETPEIAEALSLMDAVRLIDGQLVEVAGVKLLGVGDPGALNPGAAALSPADARALAGEISEALAAMEDRPDVVAVHNHRVGAAIRPGLVPLVLFGHSHAASVAFREGTAYVNAGTTGGAGVRGLEAAEPVRLSLAVIYLSFDEDGVRPLAVDLIWLSPVAGGFTLQRHLAPAR